MKKYLIILSDLFPLLLLANGGPIDESTIRSVGDLKFINTPNINVANEDLSIKIDGDFAEVKVIYTLKNGKYSDENIFYAFPIDFGFAQRNEEMDWNEKNVNFITFKKNDELLTQESQIDLQTSKDRTRRKWYFVKFDIKKNEEVKLEVHYKFKVGFVDAAFSKSFYPIFDQRTFIYDFSAAKYWGYSEAKSMNIKLDLTSLKNIHGDILHIKGINFKESDNIYTFKSNDFDFGKAPNLELSYSIKTYKTSAYLLKKSVQKEQLKKISASSQLERKYNKDNLTDLNFSTCWCAKKKDKNPTLTFTFKDSVDIATIIFSTGYLKSKEAYYNNNRLKKVAITQYYTTYGGKKEEFTYELDVKDIPYQEIDLNSFYDMVQHTDSGDMLLLTSKIEIKILETYKGKKFNDTCISEILFAGYRNGDD
ncbi:NADase-type glycan-binding domain-containing protein [Kordia sp.]|uniref:NADase-type glycan-binding domain-containing protein n=1 Tax=Kordia sp. TaxID=1965332 RepID=UPI003D6C1FE2